MLPKLKNAVAVAESGRDGEVRYFGEVDASDVSMRRIIQRIAAKFDHVHFCYEAGPTGYGLHRLIQSLGHECVVVAPSLIPRKPGDRVKTNRRDALALARLLRAGELTAVWVPDEGHEAMRDLVRARAAAVETLRVHRQQISAFILKHSRIYPRKKGWTMRYLRWLQEQQFDHLAHQIALQEMVEAVRVSKERVERLEKVIEEFIPTWSLAPVVRALQTLRGVDLIVAVTFATEVRDVTRFESPRQLMGYLGLVPGERSTGETVRRLNHQGRQRSGSAHAGRKRLDISPSAEGWREEAVPSGASASESAGDSMECSEPVDGSLSNVDRTGKANDGGLYRHCPRAQWLHVGRCKGGAVDQIVDRSIELAPRAWAGAEHRQGNTRQTLCGRHSTDARSKIGIAPDAQSGMR